MVKLVCFLKRNEGLTPEVLEFDEPIVTMDGPMSAPASTAGGAA
jgi:hypothetical protein